MEIALTIVISLVISLTVSIVVKLFIGIKWIININEIILKRQNEKKAEYNILKNWWLNNQHNFSYNKNGKIEMNKNSQKKYKRYKKLCMLYESGKLQ